MRTAGLMKCALASVVLACGSGAIAQAQSCQELWVERNSIYKQGGYCFKTARAIRYFGNAGCQYDSEREVPMSTRDRQRVDAIVREERALGCN